MRADLLVLFSLFGLFVTGCATTGDLDRLRGELGYQIEAANEKTASVERQYAPLREEIKLEIKSLHEEIAKIKTNLPSMRESQAESRAEITDVSEKLQPLRGTADNLKEEIRKESSSSAVKTSKREEAEKLFREKINDKIEALTFKINFLENFVGIDKKTERDQPAADVAPPLSPPVQPALKNGVVEPAKTDKSSAYSAAFALFQEGKYEKAREAFESFLKQYPVTEYSDNAYFWVGECYYFEKKYEKAIVQYDKVIKEFPGGNKASYALLKQGLAFLKLGDKESARLLLQQVTKDFPNTSQARIARAKLLEIK